MGTYGQSKLANLLFMLELFRRGKPLGITSVAAHPGATITNLQRHGKYDWLVKVIGQTADRGALPVLYAAVGDVQGGEFFGRAIASAWSARPSSAGCPGARSTRPSRSSCGSAPRSSPASSTRSSARPHRRAARADAMKVILFGATGMVGQGVLRECLLDPDVERVLVVGRSAAGQTHEKLRELVHADFFDLAADRASSSRATTPASSASASRRRA